MCINWPLSEDVWNSLLSLVRAPWGEDPIQMMDERGQKVEIQKAKVNEEDGLFFLQNISKSLCLTLNSITLSRYAFAQQSPHGRNMRLRAPCAIEEDGVG